MNDWKKCVDGCGAKYRRGNVCPYCATVEPEDDIFARMRTATVDDFFYSVEFPGKTARKFEQEITEKTLNLIGR